MFLKVITLFLGIVLIGEIGGNSEELAAKWWKENKIKKPMVIFQLPVFLSSI